MTPHDIIDAVARAGHGIPATFVVDPDVPRGAVEIADEHAARLNPTDAMELLLSLTLRDNTFGLRLLGRPVVWDAVTRADFVLTLTPKRVT